ncbi:MAG: hypothetical protein HYU55_15840 [Nocardioides sp.]|nr:hypothetical protein [Nocardioides sp.]
MADVQVSQPAAGVGRLGTVAAWVSAAACLPYLFLKVAWTLDLPVGLTDRSVLHSGGWVAGNAVMAAVQLVAVVLVLALVRPSSRRVPAWILLLPVWVGTGLLFPVVVGSALTVLTSTAAQDSGTELGGIAPWVYVLVYASFAVQGVALAVAFGCHVRARWGGLLNRPAGEVVALPPAQQARLGRLAAPAAVLAVAVALVCVYWAAGGSAGLSDARAHDTAGMQAARAAGALVGAAGVLGLAGRWGRERALWLPAALTWIGSGALVVFDALTVLVNRLVYLFATPPPEADWAPIDTVLVGKVLVGVLVGVVGALAISPGSAAAGAGRRTPAARRSRRSPRAAGSGRGRPR